MAELWRMERARDKNVREMKVSSDCRKGSWKTNWMISLEPGLVSEQPHPSLKAKGWTPAFKRQQAHLERRKLLFCRVLLTCGAHSCQTLSSFIKATCIRTKSLALRSGSFVLLQHCEWTGRLVDTTTHFDPSLAVCEPTRLDLC